MTRFEDIGTICYLNAIPLTYFLEGYSVHTSTPAHIAQGFRKKRFQVALLSMFEVLHHQDIWVIDGIAIAAKRDVGSVLLFLNTALEKVARVGVDSSSLTSSALLQVLFREHYQQECLFEYCESDVLMSPNDYDGYLLIGDPALKHRLHKTHYIDLAGVWRSWTGLPFVFAVWGSFRKDEQLKADLLHAQRTGLEHLDEIIHHYTSTHPFIKDYYKGLHFSLGDEEKASIQLYQEKLYNAKLLEQTHPLQYY